MKKTSAFMAVMACTALALSGCGNSVSDDRAQAYASLSSMTSLSSSQAQEYKQRLTVAPDSAAIKSVLAEAKAANEERRADDAATAAKKAANEKIIKKTEAALSGTKLVGLSDECKGITVALNADKTVETEINVSPNNCIDPRGKNWKIAVEDWSEGKPVLRFAKDPIPYIVTINGDGTVSLENSGVYKFTILKK